MNNYRIFTRTWWKENPQWPNGLEPSPGRKSTVCYVDTEERALQYCHRENAKPVTGRKKRLSWKHEFERAQ